jgi:hypothetical protein
MGKGKSVVWERYMTEQAPAGVRVEPFVTGKCLGNRRRTS